MPIRPTKRELEKSLRQVVAIGSSLHQSLVIPGNRNDPSPTGTYCVVTEVNTRTQGLPELVYARASLLDNPTDVIGDQLETFRVYNTYLQESGVDYSDINQRRLQDRVLSIMVARYNIQWIGYECADHARLFYAWCDSIGAIETWAKVGINFVRQDFLRYAPDIVTEAWEERYVTDILISYRQVIEMDPDILGTVQVIPYRISTEDTEEEIGLVDVNKGIIHGSPVSLSSGTNELLDPTSMATLTIA